MTDENHPSGSGKNGENSNQKFNWINIVDILVKLIAALVAIAVTVIAGRYQSSMTTSNLLVQREQSDSNLRTGMFKDLITPVVGSKDGNISIDRELLLVELLALNFHEHFELKPLLIHADDRLVNDKNNNMNAKQIENARNSLRSVAGRVIQQQLSSLSKADGETRPDRQTCIYYFQLKESNLPNDSKEIARSKRPCSYRQEAYFNDQLIVESPNGVYTLNFTIIAPDNWQDQRFKISMIVNKNERKKTDNTIKEEAHVDSGNNSLIYQSQIISSPDFEVTWFDFPFSDNTLLADGTRFSFVMDRVDRKDFEATDNRVTLKLGWFAVDYFSVQERPINHRQFREQLGLNLQ